MRLSLERARRFGFASVLVSLVSSTAFGAPHDFQLQQLGNPTPGGTGFNVRANDNFRVFTRQLGAAVSSVNLMPPETLGQSGFAINAELSLIHIDAGEFVFPTRTPLDGGRLLMPSLHLRKGLPFSTELGARVAWIDKSQMGAFTLEGKWAINEGYSYLPDVGIRAHGTRLVNGRNFDLTTLGLDLSVGKRVTVAGMMSLTPYVGWNLVWVQGRSKPVDFGPPRDSQSTPTEDLRAEQEQFRQVPFADNSHNRFYTGLRFIAGVLQLGVEFSVSTLGTVSVVDTENPGGPRIQERLPVIPALNTTIGLDF